MFLRRYLLIVLSPPSWPWLGLNRSSTPPGSALGHRRQIGPIPCSHGWPGQARPGRPEPATRGLRHQDRPCAGPPRRPGSRHRSSAQRATYDQCLGVGIPCSDGGPGHRASGRTPVSRRAEPGQDARNWARRKTNQQASLVRAKSSGSSVDLAAIQGRSPRRITRTKHRLCRFRADLCSVTTQNDRRKQQVALLG